MTIGIYCLQFEGTDKVYIGQSINIEKRFQEHKYNLKVGKASKKLQEAYNLFGNPTQKILLICSSNTLNLYEDIIIQYYKSHIKGLNTYEYSNQVPHLVGEDHGNSKYTNKQLIDVLMILYYNEDIGFNEISNFLNININTIKSIAAGSNHTWLKEVYPKEYNAVILNKGTKYRSQDVHCIKSLGKMYPPLLSPIGEVFKIDNIKTFAKDKGLDSSALGKVLRGQLKTHKGWKICQQEPL